MPTALRKRPILPAGAAAFTPSPLTHRPHTAAAPPLLPLVARLILVVSR